MSLYTIGKVSKSLNVSIQAIRMYQKQNLIKPVIDEQSGYRYFDKVEVGKIWRIKILQSAGFKLSEIKDMEDYKLSDIKSIIQVKKHELSEIIEKKQISLNYLDRKLEAIELYNSPSVIEVKRLEDRYGKSFNANQNDTLVDHFDALAGIKGTFGLNQEVAFQPSRRLMLKESQFVLNDLFAVHFEANDGLDKQVGGCYICLRVKGNDDTEASYNKLMVYAKENGFTLRGDAIEVLLINNNLVNRSEFNFKEIQVAVEG